MGLAAQATVDTQLQAKQAVAMQMAAFARASCEVQAMVVQKLMAENRLVVDYGGIGGEYDDIAAAAEGDYDSEVEFVDDDEVRDDGDSFSSYASPDGESMTRLDPLPRVYEIKVVECRSGCWMCAPPRNPLLGYRAVDKMAQLTLDAARRQFAFYEAVAKWLQSEGDEVLESPEGFKEHHRPMKRKDFCPTDFCKDVGFTSKDEPNIRAYCQKCRLVWPRSSLPLTSVFTSYSARSDETRLKPSVVAPARKRNP